VDNFLYRCHDKHTTEKNMTCWAEVMELDDTEQTTMSDWQNELSLNLG